MKSQKPNEQNKSKEAVKLSYSFIVKSGKYGSIELLIDEDKKDLVTQYSWSVTKQGRRFYALSSTWCTDTKKSKFFYLHRFVTDFKYPLVDHINGDTLDNRSCNLRSATHSINSRNRVRGKYERDLPNGVYKRGSKYFSRFVLDREIIHVGTFDTVLEAETKRMEAMRERKIEL